MPAPDPVLGRVKVVSFPVPAFENRLLRVLRDPNSAGYELLAEGTLLGDCGFCREGDATKYGDGFLLCKIRPNPETGYHEWYFLNPRDNEDAYNFETAYDGEHKDYPIVTRSYLVLRTELSALTFDDTDPANNELTLVAQKQVRSDDPVIDSLFVGIQRVFQKLPGALVHGQEFDESLGVPIPYTEQPVKENTGIGEHATYIKPESAAKALKRVYDVEAVRASLDAYYDVVPRFNSRIPIPDEMTSLEVLWAEDSADGSFESDFAGTATGPNRSLTGSESANAHGSCAVMPELAVVRKVFVQNNVPTLEHVFFVESPATHEDVLDRLSTLCGQTVTRWPVFQAESLTFVLSGAKASVSVQASASASQSHQDGRDPEDSGDDSDMNDKTEGSGTSKDYSPAISVQTLPPMIHGGFSLSSTRSKTATASCAVEWSGTNFPSVSVSESGSVTATGEVSPSSRGATSPASVPTTGLYLVDLKPEPFPKWGRTKIYAEVLDASSLVEV